MILKTQPYWLNKTAHHRESDHTTATVSRIHKGRFLVRVGRGYSHPELLAAGLSSVKAEKLGVHVDQRRRTSYDFNVSRLKEIASAPAAALSPEASEEAR